MSKIFPKNEHHIERGLRVLIGALAISLYFIGPKTPWGLLGILPLTTGLLGSCPLYTLLGLSTCPVSDSK